jgi:hypothetical protein
MHRSYWTSNHLSDATPSPGDATPSPGDDRDSADALSRAHDRASHHAHDRERHAAHNHSLSHNIQTRALEQLLDANGVPDHKEQDAPTLSPHHPPTAQRTHSIENTFYREGTRPQDARPDTKETYTDAKQTYTDTEETYSDTKETYTKTFKETYERAKEIYPGTKKTYRAKETNKETYPATLPPLPPPPPPPWLPSQLWFFQQGKGKRAVDGRHLELAHDERLLGHADAQDNETGYTVLGHRVFKTVIELNHDSAGWIRFLNEPLPLEGLEGRETRRETSPVFYAHSCSVYEEGRKPMDRLRAPKVARRLSRLLSRSRVKCEYQCRALLTHSTSSPHTNSAAPEDTSSANGGEEEEALVGDAEERGWQWSDPLGNWVLVGYKVGTPAEVLVLANAVFQVCA